jgi:peroxiredoxin
MKKLPAFAALAAGAVILYFLASPRPAAPPAAAPDQHDVAAPLSAPALDGKTVSLADFKGKVVLVDFWATWCDPCREEIPDLVKLQARLKDKGFTILGVSMDERGAAAVNKFTAKQPISYPVILNGGERAPKGWVVPGLPTAYLVGRDGTVLKRWFGEKDPAELEAAVNAALAR